MHFTIPVSIFILNLSLTLAVTNASPTNTTANTTITPPSRYYLKTRVIGDGNADKDGLYVSSYHTGPLTLTLSYHSPPHLKATNIVLSNAATGPGLSDATLIPFSPTSTTVGFLNDTHQQFDFDTSVPFGMIMEASENLDVGMFISFLNSLKSVCVAMD